MSLGVRRSLGMDPHALAAASRAALDVPLEDEAELWIARPSEDAIVLGAFQRSASLAAPTAPVVQRGSGGPAVRIGEGTLWVALLLPRVDALVACDEHHLVNRYVRPLLRALTRSGALAHFFGRDWVSVRHRPAAWIGFAHDRASGRAVIEAFVARATPFDLEPRGSYMGKTPGTLEEITGVPVEEEKLVETIVASYAEAYGRVAIERGTIPELPALPMVCPPSLAPFPPKSGGRAGEGGQTGRRAGEGEQTAWLATLPEIIGPLSAGPDALGRFRLGGDLLVSRDALASLEAALPDAPDDALDPLIDAHLAAPRVALDGVRSLTSVRDVILAARRALREGR